MLFKRAGVPTPRSSSSSCATALLFSRDQERFWFLYSTGVFFSDNAPVRISSVVKFVTGSPCIPAIGLCKQITVKFKHDCLSKNGPGVCKCLPTVSTCEIILNLPVHITTEEEMMSVF